MVIRNSIIPFKGFAAINLFGIIFVRREWWEAADEERRLKLLTHEAIHTAQQRELLYIGFYLLYLLEWIWQIIIPPKGAYRWISFEREAYANERNFNYLNGRKRFAQWRRRK